MFAVFYPDVGKLAGYLGSMSGLGCIYVLPTITNLKSSYTQIKHPLLAEAIRQNEFDYKVHENPEVSPKLQVRGKFIVKNIKKVKRDTTEDSRRMKFYLDLAITIVIIAFGLFVVIAQYF